MNIQEAQGCFEKKFSNVVRAGGSARAPNGKPYIEISGGGSPNQSALASWWLQEAEKLASGHSDTLYWRVEPTIEGSGVFSRFATQ